MASSVDYIVNDEKGYPSLLVEVKALPDRSEQWARKMRRNLSVHSPLPEAPFFLLALPDQFFLWVDHAHLDPTAPPSYTVDAKPLLSPYFDRAGLSPEKAAGATFELIVWTWLLRIIQSPSSDALPEGDGEWLLDTGLFEAIQGGHIEQKSGIPA
jgi:hypothetical protein